jgi:hypothetical protein
LPPVARLQGPAASLRAVGGSRVLLLVDPDAGVPGGPGVAGTGLGTLISAARVRWLACDGSISRVVMGPDGRILDHGRDKRLIPAGLRRTLDVRDEHCIFAGCEAPAWWCDVGVPRFRGRLCGQFGVGVGAAVSEG